MAQTTKRAKQRLVKKRNHTFDSITFYKRYADVYAAQMDEKNALYMQELSNKAKMRLLPLELAARPAAEVNKWQYAKILQTIEAKQAMKRREIQQSYIRKAAKIGDASAAEYREKALAQLDLALKRHKEEFEAKYPLDSTEIPSDEAVAKYKAAELSEQNALIEAMAQLEAKKTAKIQKVKARTAKKCKNLQAKFDAYNAALDQFSNHSEADFGADTLLRIQNLKMYFSGVKAVDDISFDIKKGEIFGLIGPNGAGKTTIFNCVTQFYKPTGGNVLYRDKFGKIVDLTDYKTHDVIKCGISRTFQNLELVLGLSILDNLKVGANSLYHANLFNQLFHTKRLRDEEKVTQAEAERILNRLGLGAYKNALPQGQPYGVLKKIELGRTLMTHPQMIILDEPAAGLNDAETAELAETIRHIRDEFHCTIFLVEHDMNLVMNICDTICVTSFGKRLAIGTPKEVRANPAVQEAYLGAEEGDEA